MTQGRCVPCCAAFRWTEALRLSDAACPFPHCGRPLTRTTKKLVSVRWHDRTPALRKTDGKEYLSAGDAREAAALLRDFVENLESLPEGLKLTRGGGSHAVTITAVTVRHDGGKSAVKVWVPRADTGSVWRALACAVGGATKPRRPGAVGDSYSGYFGDAISSLLCDGETYSRGVGMLCLRDGKRVNGAA